MPLTPYSLVVGRCEFVEEREKFANVHKSGTRVLCNLLSMWVEEGCIRSTWSGKVCATPEMVPGCCQSQRQATGRSSTKICVDDHNVLRVQMPYTLPPTTMLATRGCVVKHCTCITTSPPTSSCWRLGHAWMRRSVSHQVACARIPFGVSSLSSLCKFASRILACCRLFCKHAHAQNTYFEAHLHVSIPHCPRSCLSCHCDFFRASRLFLSQRLVRIGTTLTGLRSSHSALVGRRS